MTMILKTDVASMLSMAPSELPTRENIETKLRCINYTVHNDRSGYQSMCQLVDEFGMTYVGYSTLTPAESFNILTSNEEAYNAALLQASAVNMVLYEKKKIIAESKVLEEATPIEAVPEEITPEEIVVKV